MRGWEKWAYRANRQKDYLVSLCFSLMHIVFSQMCKVWFANLCAKRKWLVWACKTKMKQSHVYLDWWTRACYDGGLLVDLNKILNGWSSSSAWGTGAIFAWMCRCFGGLQRWYMVTHECIELLLVLINLAKYIRVFWIKLINKMIISY